MALTNPYQAYQQNSVSTASPGELTLMLYNGCLKFIKQARTAMEQKQVQEKNINLQKAQRIIQELMITLNPEAEVSGSMMQMYEYINRRLVEANISNDPEILSEAEEHVTEFRDAWKQIIQSARRHQFGQGGPI